MARLRANEPILSTRLPMSAHRRPCPAWLPIDESWEGGSPSGITGSTSIAASCTPGSPTRRLRLHPFQPDLTPPAHELAWAVGAESPLADDVLEDDAGVLHGEHAAGLLVDAPVGPGLHPRGATTEPGHLGVEAHPAVEQVVVERRHDLFA